MTIEEKKAIVFLEGEISNNESLPALLVKFSNTDNKGLLEKLKSLEAKVREQEQFAENARDETQDALEEANSIRRKMADLEDLDPNTLEEDMKLKILKRIYKNCNITEIEDAETYVKAMKTHRGRQYQDYD